MLTDSEIFELALKYGVTEVNSIIDFLTNYDIFHRVPGDLLQDGYTFAFQQSTSALKVLFILYDNQGSLSVMATLNVE